MKEQLDRIIKKCLKYEIPVRLEVDDNGEEFYFVDGFSKSRKAKLSCREDFILCETRYGREDKIITFIDLAYIAKHWYNNYKGDSKFKEPHPGWKVVFGDIDMSYLNLSEDLPF